MTVARQVAGRTTVITKEAMRGAEIRPLWLLDLSRHNRLSG
ncbi:hypothetical protein [Nonomuraea sp. NPDC002799]